MSRKSIIWKLSKEELQELINNSVNFVEVLAKIGLSTHSGNHRTLKKRIVADNIDITKIALTRKQTFKNKTTFFKLIDNNKFFSKNTYRSGNSLKKRLIRDFNIEYRCVLCSNTGSHNNKPLSLQIDHIDGDNRNNEIKNLRFLCPNCHSQTHNYSGKNKKNITNIE